MSKRRKLYNAAILAALLYDSKELYEILLWGRDDLTPLKRAAILRVLVLRNYGLDEPLTGPYPQQRRAVRKALGI